MFLFGLLIYNLEVRKISILGSQETVFYGTLSDYPEEKEKSYKMALKLEGKLSEGSFEPVSGSIVLYNKKDKNTASFLPGDKLSVKCTPVTITSRGNPFEFDYRFYMQCHGTGYYAFTDSSDIIIRSVPKHRNLIYSSLIDREKIIDMFRERGIKGKKLALVAAITLGQKNMLDPEQKQYFIKAGIMHIMAVSGLHAVILSLFVFNVLFFLKGRLNILRVILTLIILWLFSFVTGLTPSVLRATLMFSFLQAGNIMKRPVNSINSVLASAFVLILIRPSVIFDAGFQLSYAAVIYIIVFYYNLYQKIMFRHRITDLIWQSVAVTVIAQAGTLPLTVMLFNRFPVWFILSNVIIVPISSLVIIIGCLVPVFYPVKFISESLAWILGHITGLTELLTEKAASLPMATLDNIGLTSIECILLTITIFTFILFLLKRKSIPVAYPLTALLLFVLAGTIKAAVTMKSDELIVYNSTGRTTVGIRSGKMLRIYSDTIEGIPEVNRHSSAMNLKVSYNLIDSDAMIIKTDRRNVLVTSILNDSVIEIASPDMIIIRGKPFIQKDIRPVSGLKAVIISPETLQGAKFSTMIMSLGADSIHSVSKDGAFCNRL